MTKQVELMVRRCRNRERQSVATCCFRGFDIPRYSR